MHFESCPSHRTTHKRTNRHYMTLHAVQFTIRYINIRSVRTFVTLTAAHYPLSSHGLCYDQNGTKYVPLSCDAIINRSLQPRIKRLEHYRQRERSHRFFVYGKSFVLENSQHHIRRKCIEVVAAGVMNLMHGTKQTHMNIGDHKLSIIPCCVSHFIRCQL